ncbi:MAG: GTPase HflX [Nitrospirota bacterium]|nr:GTPase HflX [Nitrospirota bacterium]
MQKDLDAPEKAILVYPVVGKAFFGDWQADFDELKELVRSADLDLVDEEVVFLKEVNSKTLIGKGKLEELRGRADALGVDLAVLGVNASPSKERNLEEALGVPVVDRTQLILGIFAKRARSKEGKVQVELAQLRDLLPRLSGKGGQLSRLGGGIGTRGPGEKKLEVDRRRIGTRIHVLKQDLKQVERHRRLQRGSGRRKAFPMLALIGYTNAGKSSLFNMLTHAHVVAEDRLFATLDPTVRRVRLPSAQEALLVDTVGIIRDMPENLLQAFRATFEDFEQADAYIHVVDGSQPNYRAKIEEVNDVLRKLELLGKPVLYALNKSDLIQPEKLCLEEDLRKQAVVISTKTSDGIPKLIESMEGLLEALAKLPAPKGGAVGL